MYYQGTAGVGFDALRAAYKVMLAGNPELPAFPNGTPRVVGDLALTSTILPNNSSRVRLACLPAPEPMTASDLRDELRRSCSPGQSGRAITAVAIERALAGHPAFHRLKGKR